MCAWVVLNERQEQTARLRKWAPGCLSYKKKVNIIKMHYVSLGDYFAFGQKQKLKLDL